MLTLTLDRDCALTLGWVQTILNTAILQLPESFAPLSLKTDAIAAISKVCSSSRFPRIRSCTPPEPTHPCCSRSYGSRTISLRVITSTSEGTLTKGSGPGFVVLLLFCIGVAAGYASSHWLVILHVYYGTAHKLQIDHNHSNYTCIISKQLSFTARMCRTCAGPRAVCFILNTESLVLDSGAIYIQAH